MLRSEGHKISGNKIRRVLLSPGTVLALIILLNSLSPLLQRYGSLHPLWMLYAYLAITFVWRYTGSGLPVIRVKLPDVLFFIFIAACIISVALYTETEKIKAYKYVIGYMLFPYIAARLLNKNDILNLVYVVLTAGIVCLVVAIVLVGQSYFHKGAMECIAMPGGGCAKGLLGLPIAAALVVSCYFYLSGSNSEISPRSSYFLIIIVFSIIVLVHLSARSMLLSSLVAVIWVLFVLRNKFTRDAKLLLVIFISYIGFSYSVAPAYSLDKARELLDISKLELLQSGGNELDCIAIGNSVKMRLFMYRDAWEMASKNKLTGVGVGNYASHSCFYRDMQKLYTDMNFSQPFSSPHNTLLHVISELGLIAGAVFSLIIIIIGLCIARSSGVIITSDGGVYILSVSLWIAYVISDSFNGSYLVATPFYILSSVLVSLLCMKYERVA